MNCQESFVKCNLKDLSVAYVQLETDCADNNSWLCLCKNNWASQFEETPAWNSRTCRKEDPGTWNCTVPSMESLKGCKSEQMIVAITKLA